MTKWSKKHNPQKLESKSCPKEKLFKVKIYKWHFASGVNTLSLFFAAGFNGFKSEINFSIIAINIKQPTITLDYRVETIVFSFKQKELFFGSRFFVAIWKPQLKVKRKFVVSELRFISLDLIWKKGKEERTIWLGRR